MATLRILNGEEIVDDVLVVAIGEEAECGANVIEGDIAEDRCN